MSAPTNAIKKVKVPTTGGVSSEYEVIPERLQSNGYTAAPPALTKDSNLVIEDALNQVSVSYADHTLSIDGLETGSLSTKQDALVSGTNIKTINSTSLLGSGDITISSSSLGLVRVYGTLTCPEAGISAFPCYIDCFTTLSKSEFTILATSYPSIEDWIIHSLVKCDDTMNNNVTLHPYLTKAKNATKIPLWTQIPSNGDHDILYLDLTAGKLATAEGGLFTQTSYQYL